METTMFSNDMILSWLHYFSESVDMNIADLKILDITGKTKFNPYHHESSIRSCFDRRRTPRYFLSNVGC